MLVSSSLGDLARTKGVKAVQTRLLRMRNKGWQLCGPGKYTEAEDEYLLNETRRYRRHNPTRVWTRTAMQRHFPEMVYKHGLEPLRSKLRRLLASESATKSATNGSATKSANCESATNFANCEATNSQTGRSEQHTTYMLYAPEEIEVLVRAALNDSFPSDLELRTILKKRSLNAIRLKIRYIQAKLLRGQPELAAPLDIMLEQCP